MSTLALTYLDADRLDRALPLFEEVSPAREGEAGSRPLPDLDAVYKLALTDLDTGRLDRAIPLLEEVVRLRKAKLGTDHLDTLLAHEPPGQGLPGRATLDRGRGHGARMPRGLHPDAARRLAALSHHEPARRRAGRAEEVRRGRAAPDRGLRGA